jgi:scyllo-inositol 2-dehydrogenase (NADP+)
VIFALQDFPPGSSLSSLYSTGPVVIFRFSVFMISHQKIAGGLIGFGLSGRYLHAPFLSVHPGFHLKKVVSRHPDDVAAFDPTLETVASVDDLLADNSLQLIFICSPNETHFQYARAALEANKHVVVEKPFALQESETTQLLALAAERGLIDKSKA